MIAEIPEYLKLNENGRYECTKCGETVSKLFADLGCDCNGEGRSTDFETIKTEAQNIVWRLKTEKNSLTESEKSEILEELKEELE